MNLTSTEDKLPLKSVLFDLDGTLLCSIDVLKEAFQCFLESQGLLFSQSEFDQFNGDTIPDIASSIKNKHELKSDLDELVRIYKCYLSSSYGAANPFPESTGVLRTLKSQDIKLALVTSSIGELVDPLLERLSWSEVFDVVVTGEVVSHTKPAPDPYMRALERLGIEASSCVAVEDSPSGLIAAKMAGILSIGTMTGGHSQQDLVEAGASYTVKSMKDLLILLEERCIYG